MATKKKKDKFLYTDSQWTFPKIDKVYEAIKVIADEELGLDYYTNQIEIISSEQMIDAYTSVGMPIMYPHWSFGKRFVTEQRQYDSGRTGLAYEIVINSDPCISFCMEENSMTMTTLVIAHAAFGHNHFFKNNYLFRDWTDAKTIISYLIFAKQYIQDCEQKYGISEVERTLNSCHALKGHGVNKYHRPAKMTKDEEKVQQEERQKFIDENVNHLWNSVCAKPRSDKEEELEGYMSRIEKEKKRILQGSQENLLYFIEKHSPILEPWQREVVRIVRKIAQYFYPQIQTKVMNEGCATFVHYYIMNRLYDKNLINEAAMMEFMISHANVINQYDFDAYGYYKTKDGKRKKYSKYSGINPYALGFDMFMDIKRICTNPTDEDREWFPDIVDTNWAETFRDIVKNYNDESFILQYLSPKVIRDWKLFIWEDDYEEDHYNVGAIHDEKGYEKVRKQLAKNYSMTLYQPDIRIVDVDFKGDRSIYLNHISYDDVELDYKQTQDTLKHFCRLWGHDVYLTSIDYGTNDPIEEFTAKMRIK